MRRLALIVRVIFGLAFTVFGLNGVLLGFDLAFMPPPPDLPAAAADFMGALAASRYMLPLLGGTQLVAGLMILSGLFTPLGLALLAPVVVNIVLYHLYVDPNGLGIAWAVLAIELFLAWAYAPAFRDMLAARARTRWSA